MPAVKASPRKALADAPVYILVQELKKYQDVTIYSEVTSEDRITYICIAHYTADSTGCVDLNKTPSTGGYYVGIEPMGLFWAMKISSDCDKKYSRLEKKDVTKPFIVSLQVFGSHLNESQISQETPLASTEVERWYMNEGVRRLPIKVGRVRATLFIPESPGRHPGLIDIFGSKGGITEFRASLLASHGFVTMALAYFNYDDLVLTENLELEYFYEAFCILAGQDSVMRGSIGIIGICFGGTIALAMASYFPGIRCVVSINAAAYFHGVNFSYKGKVWPQVPWEMDKITAKNNVFCIRDGLNVPTMNNLRDSMLDFHKCRASILFIFSMDDASLKAEETVKLVKEMLNSSGKHNYEIVEYPGAGHLLEPPHSPFFYATYSLPGGYAQCWGGNLKDHIKAQEKAWDKILHFLRTNLVDCPKL